MEFEKFQKTKTTVLETTLGRGEVAGTKEVDQEK